MSSLSDTVDASLEAFVLLAVAIDNASGSLRPGMRATLDTQIRSLGVLADECGADGPTRRTWSLGQAALPVLSSLVNAAAKPAVGTDPEAISRCRAALSALGPALLAHAEGR